MLLNETDKLASISNVSLCLGGFFLPKCYWAAFGYTLGYWLFAFALLPQIIYLFQYRARYIAGISYTWIIIRLLALTSLMVTHRYIGPIIMDFIAILFTIVIFIQILIFSNSLHRQNKLFLVLITVSIWFIGRILLHIFIKQQYIIIIINYVLLAIEMLPQILLNSLLRTTKGVSKMSILFLLISYLLFWIYLPISNTNIRLIHLISIYYCLSFLLYIFLQTLIYSDAHIHLISRSVHTVLTPGVDLFTGLDINATRVHGQDPQIFANDDLESFDGSDIIYQAVTTNKPAKPTIERTPFEKYLWYIGLACIFSIETMLTILLVYNARSPWIITVPFSILLLLGIFFLLRTRLNVSQIDFLRKIL